MADNTKDAITDSRIPGLNASSWYSTNAQGTDGAVSHPGGGGEFGGQRVSDPYNSAQAPADLPMAPQGFGSTNAASVPTLDVVSGVDETSASWSLGDPSSHVTGPSHPNSMTAGH